MAPYALGCDWRDWTLEERIKKALEDERGNQPIDLKEVPVDLWVSSREESDNLNHFNGDGNFLDETWQFLINLRLLVMTPNMTLISTESTEDIESDFYSDFYLSFFVPVDSRQLEDSFDAFQYAIARGVYLTSGFRLGLPSSLQKLRQLTGRFIQAPHR